MFKFETAVAPEVGVFIPLPKVKSFIERRVMNRFPGRENEWISRLETADSGKYLQSQATEERTITDIVIIPELTVNLPGEKMVSTLGIMLYLDNADIINAEYGS
jgi:hypothetical protein